MKNLIQLDLRQNMVVDIIIQLILMIDLMFESLMLKMNSIEIMVVLIKNLFNCDKSFAKIIFYKKNKFLFY